MMPYEQQEFYLHGVKFIVRCVPYSRPNQNRTNWRIRRPYAHNIGRFTLFCEGRFVGRFKKAQIRKWAQHCALKALIA